MNQYYVTLYNEKDKTRQGYTIDIAQLETANATYEAIIAVISENHSIDPSDIFITGIFKLN